MNRERAITVAIIVGLFGGLVGGPVASLADYYGPPERRLLLFAIPEIIGFARGSWSITASQGKKKSRKPDYCM